MATTNTLPIRLIRTLLTAAALTALAACGGSTSAPPPSPESRPAGTAVIGSGGGQVSGVDGASITVPAGALRTDATIVITRDGSEAPPLPQGFKLASDVFALLPHGATLARPATVRLPFDATRIAANEQPAVLKASPGQPWELIEDVRVEGNTLTFETSRFSWTAIIAGPRGRFVPPSFLPPPVVPPTISETGAVINLTPPTELPRLTATGSNVQIVQQNDPAQDVSIGVSFGFGAQSAIAQACNSSGWTEPVQVSTVFSPAAIYRLPSDGNAGGINRVAVDLDAADVRRPNVALQPDDSTGDGFFNYPHVAPMYGRRYQGIESVNTAFTQWNPSSVATFSGVPQSVIPADAIVEGWGVHVTLLVLCPTNSGRASVVIPTAVQPVVVVRGFPVDDIVVTSRPPAVVSALQGEYADVGVSGATAPAGITLTHTWEQLTPGASSWTPVPRVPAGSLPEFYLYQSALQPNAPAVVGGVLSQALHNGTRLRFRVCGNFPPSGAERCAYSLETLLRVSQNYPLPSVVRQPSATGTATFNVGQRLLLSAEFTPQVYRGQLVWQTRRSDTEPWAPVSATEFDVWGAPSWTASVPFTSFVRASATVLSTADRGRQFRAVYSVPSGSVTTNPVTIQVSTGQTPPSFTAQPQDAAVAAGSPVLFAAAVTGAQPMSYRWLFNGQPILGANSPLLTLNGANAGNAGLYELEVSNVEATVRSRAARLTVTTGAPGQATAPTITTQPASVTVAAGSAVSFGVTARGTGTLSYQWRRSGTALTGATSQVLALNTVTNADAGEYSVVVSDGAGQSVTSATAVLNVGPASPGTSVAPTISTQPIGLTASTGQTVTFAVAASGSGPLSYQWQRSGSALPNTNSPVLTLTNVQAANAGDYTVVISNSAGSVTSNAAGLVVTPVPGTPVIVASPSDRSAFVGGTATFTATVTGNPTPQCQWTRNGVAVGGATSCASYTTPALTLADNGAIYNLVAFNAAGAVFGSGAVLSVQAPTAPAITTQPTSQTITLPHPAIFSVAFTGAPTPEIIWNINGTDLPFGAGLTFTAGACTGGYTNLGGVINLSGLSAGCNGATVRVRLSNSAGSVTSSTVTLTVNPAAVAPAITTQPTSQTITLPNPAIFSVAFTGSPTPEIIWNINGTDLPFGAGLTFTAGACTGGYTNLGGVINLSGLSAGCNGATVRVRLSNSAGSVTSSTVTLTVNPAAVAPVITTQPTSQTITAGGGASFTVTATGTPTPTYAWTLNGSPVGSGAFNIGACVGNASTSNGGAQLSLTSVSVQCNGATISVTASNGVNPNATASTTLTVNAPSPSVTTQPQSVTVTAGQPATFTAVLANAPHVQWERNGTPIPGATSQSYTLGTTTTADNGATFRLLGCTLPGPSGACVYTNFVTLTVNAAPQITQPPLAQSITAGGGATYMVTATGSPAPTYAWTLNGSAVGSGAFTIGSCTGGSSTSNGGATLSLTTVALACNGVTIGVTASNGINPNATASAGLTVNPAGVAPAFTTQPQSASFTAGGGALFVAVASGTPAPTYAWSINGTTLSPAASATAFTAGTCSGSYSTSNGSLTLSALVAGCGGANLFSTATNASGSATSNTVALTLQGGAAPVITAFPGPGSNAPRDEGQVATVTVTATGTNLTYQWLLTYDVGSTARTIPGATSASYTTPVLTQGYNNASLQVRVCSGPQPADTGAAANCTFSSLQSPLGQTYEIGANGACFGAPDGWCYRSPTPQGGDLTGLVLPDSNLSPDAPVVAVGYGTVLESNDFGANWTLRFATPRLDFRSLARRPDASLLVAPVAANTAQAVSGGLYASSDGGATWNAVLSVSAPNTVNDVAFGDNNIAVAVGTGLWRSTDGGVSWAQVSTAAYMPPETLLRVTARGSTVLAVGDNGNILRSTDGGASWNRVRPGNSERLVDVSLNGNGRAVAVAENTTKIWVSTDGGASWVERSTLPFANARAGAIDLNNRIVVLSSQTLTFISDDLGLNWTTNVSAQRNSDRWRLALSDFGGGEALAVGRWGAMIRSGFEFTFYGIGGGGESGGTALGADITAMESANGVTLLVRDGYVGRSGDGGATWQGFGQPARTLSMLDADRAFATLQDGGTARVLRSSDGGQNWNEVGNQSGDQLTGISMANNSVGVLIGTRSGQPQVFHTTNGGVFWAPVPGLPSGFAPSSVRALNPAPLADASTAVILVGSNDGRILRTVNGGTSWLTLSPGIGGVVRQIARIDASTAIAAADDGLWRSTDAGLNWTRVYDSTAFGSMTAVAADPAGGRCVAVGVVGVLIGSGCQTFGAPVDLPYVGELRAAAWPTLSNVLAGGKGGTLLINRNDGLPAAPPPPMGAFGQRAGTAGPRATAPSQRVVLPAAVGKQARAAALLRPVQPSTRPPRAQRRSDPLPPTPPPRVGPQRESLLPFARKPAGAADGKAR